MANYKLTTAEPASLTSFLALTASATDTIITSVVASDNATSTLEALIQKSAGNIIEVAHAVVQADKPEELLTAPLALEAGDKLYVRTTKAGAKFVISYVEDTDIPNDTALGGLADVDTTGFSDGDALVYSTSNGGWGPAAISGGGGGATDLDGLSDVAVSGAGSGDVLRHDGSNFVNVSLNTYIDAQLATIDADDIDDASTTHRFVTAQMQENLGYLAPVTGNIDLDQHDTDIAVNNLKQGYTTALFDADLAASNTGDLAEGTNLYYTEARVSANADVTANSLKRSYPAADETKLAGIAAGATVNDTDVNLKDRANHTGTQLSSTISDFTAETETIIADVIGSTSDVSEGTNLYYTDARVDARIGVADIADLNNVSATAPSNGQVLKWNGTAWAPAADNSSTGGAGGVVDSVNGISQAAVVLDADDIDDSSTAHKFVAAGDVTKLSHISVTQAVDLDTMETDIAANSLKQGYTTALFDADLASSDTGDLAEGTNLYYTEARVSANTDVAANTLKRSYPSADETKLAGIATGATANSTDAVLKDRANHLGTQLASTISDFGSASASIAISTVQLSDLQDLNNVDVPTTGEYLKWNGTTWETDAVTGGSGGVVDSVNGISQAAVVLDADDIDDATTTHKFVAAADVTKLGLITVASAVDLDSVSSLATFAATTANTAQSAITSHENSLRNHLDVTYSEANPANIPVGSFLQWQGAAWEDGEVDLQDLANVDVPTTGEYLKWNGTTWETDAVSGGGGGTTVMDADTALTAAGNYEAGARLMKLVNTNTTLAAGKVYQLLASGWDAATNATEAGSSGLMAVCSSDSTTGSAMIMEGIFRTRINLSAAAIGDPLYLSTGSEFTLTAPTSAATVRKMGYVVDPSNNMAYYSPDETTITIQ